MIKDHTEDETRLLDELNRIVKETLNISDDEARKWKDNYSYFELRRFSNSSAQIILSGVKYPALPAEPPKFGFFSPLWRELEPKEKWAILEPVRAHELIVLFDEELGNPKFFENFKNSLKNYRKHGCKEQEK